MKYAPATSLFLAAYVLLALSAPPAALAQNHGLALRQPARHTTTSRRVVHTAADDDDDDQGNDDDEDEDTTTPKTTNPSTPNIPPSNGNCRRQVRQEIRDLTDDQRMRYFRAIRAIMRRPTSGAPSEYDRLVYEHYHYNADNHGFPAFLPWHRIFIRRFEMALQRVDSSIVIPYWDWSADSNAPELSPIFRPDWYGGNGDRNRRLCIQDGYFKDFRPFYSPNNAGCLTRNWTGGRRINAFASPEIIANLVTQSRDFNAFRMDIELTPHGAVHNGIGGKGGIFSTMYSPNDPIFWLHHAMIDKIFMDWQLLAPSTRVNQYLGTDRNHNRVSPNGSMLVAYNVPARVGLQFNVMGACVSYAPAVNAYRNRQVPRNPPRTGGGSSGGSGRPTRPPRNPPRRPPPKKKVIRRRIIRRPPPRRHHLIRRGDKLSTANDVSQVVPVEDNEFPVDPSKAAPPAQAPQDAVPEDAAPAADAAPEATAPLAQAEVNAPVEAAEPDTQKSETKAVSEDIAAKSATDAPKAEEPKKAEETQEPKKTEEPKAEEPKKVEESKKAEEPKVEKPTKTEETKETKETEETAKPTEETKVDLPSNSTLASNATTNGTDLSGTNVVVIDAPKPSDLPKTCTDAAGLSIPCPDDRENILDLRAPAPLPEWWLEMNNLDVEGARKQEEESRKIVAKLNALDGYISPAALWNKEDFLAELAKKGTDFKCVYKGKVIKVDYDKDSVTSGYRTIEKVKKQIEYVGVPTYKPITYLEPKLNKILGKKTVKRLRKKFEKTPTVYKEITYDDDDDVCEADDDY